MNIALWSPRGAQAGERTRTVGGTPAIKALVRNLSAFTTLFAPGKSWDNVRTTTAPYTESRLAHLVRNKCVGFPVVEHT